MPQSVADDLAADLAAIRSPTTSLDDDLAADLAAVRSTPRDRFYERQQAVAELDAISPPKKDELGPGNYGKFGPGTRPPVRQAEVVAMTPATITEPPNVRAPERGQRGDIPYIPPDPVRSGIREAVGGASALGRIQQQAEQQGTISGDATMKAASDMLTGIFHASEPVLGAAFVMNPVATIFGLAEATYSSLVGSSIAKFLGATDEGQRFVGTLAASVSAAHRVGEPVAKFVERNLADATAVLKQAKRFDAANPQPAKPTEPVPAGRGRTEGAQAAGPRLEADNAPPRPPEPLQPPPGPTSAPVAPAAPSPAPVVPQTPETRLASLQPAEPGNSRAVPFPVELGPLVDQLNQAALTGRPHEERDIPMAAVIATQPSIDPTITQNYLKTRAPLTGKLPIVVEWGDKFYLMDGTHRAVAEWVFGADTLRANVITVDPQRMTELAAPKPPSPPSGVIRPAATEPVTAPPPVPGFTQMEGAPPEFHAVKPDDLEADLAAARETRAFSSTQVQLPPRVATRVLDLAASLPDDVLAEKGRETDPHVTVKFGIHTKDVAAIRGVLATEPPVRVVLGKTSIFPNSESGNGDVLKVDVDSPDLHRLNAKIAKFLDTTDTHPTYAPHATIAYIKPGFGAQFVGRDDLEGETTTIDQVVFSTPEGEKVVIQLTGAAKEPEGFKEKRDAQRREEKPARVGEAVEAVSEPSVESIANEPPINWPMEEERGEMQLLALQKKLGWAWVQDGKIGRWKPVAAVRVEVPGVSATLYAHKTTGGKTWEVTEETSGLSLGTGATREAAVESATAKAKQHGASKVTAAIAKGAKDRPAKPMPTDLAALKVTKTKPATSDVLPPGPADTPTEAAATIEAALEETVDIAGAKNATEVRDRVMAALQRQILGAERAEIRVEQARVANHAAHEAWRKKPKETRSEHAPVPFPATEERIKIAIPGDGDFTIERTVAAIKGTMDRLRRGGPAPWKGLIAQEKVRTKSSGAKKGESRGAAAMPYAAGGLPPRPKPATQTVALPVNEIVNKLSLLFDKVPVNVGHFRNRARAIYKVDPQAVRSRQADDLYAIAHEFGHHIDLALMRGSATHVRGDIAKELKTLGAPTSRDSYSAAQRRQEGAAEFFRIWLLEPERLPVEAPKYLREFERYLTGAPEIHAGLLEVRDDIQQYLSLSGLDQAKLSIDFTGGSTSILARAQRLYTQAVDDTGRRDALTYLSSQFVDDLAWIGRVERDIAAGRPIDIRQSAIAYAHLARGYSAKAEGFLEFGVRDKDGQFLGPSFDAAVQTVMGQIVEFNVYLKAKHAADMEVADVVSGLSGGQIAEALQLQSPAFDKAADQIAAFQHAMRLYMVDRGIWSSAQMRAMERKWPNYVPMKRLMDAAERALGSTGGRRIANRGSTVKRLKGSGRRTLPALESIISNTHEMVSAAEANKAMLALVDLVTTNTGTAKMMEKIPAPEVPTRFNLADIEDAIREDLEKAGIDLPTDFNFDDLATVWTPRQFAQGDKRFVTVINQGEVEWFEVHEPGLYDAITSIGPQNTAEVIKLFWKGAQTLRKFATTTLGFVFRNPTRDISTALVQTRAGFTPLDFLRGLFSYLGKDDEYQLFLHSGAGTATLVSGDRVLVRRRIKDLGKTKLRQFLNHTVLGPIDGLQALSHAMETATRLGEFKKSLAKHGRDEAGLMQSGLNARDVTQDFAVAGRQVRAFNNYTAFFSARVGGYTRLYQAWKEGGRSLYAGSGGGAGLPPGPPTINMRPSGPDRFVPESARGPLRFLWKALPLSLLSLLLWVLHRNDEEYQDLPAWERNAYWHIPLPSGGYIRLMKPFEIGTLFGSSVEVALDYLVAKDPRVVDRLPDRQSAEQSVQMIIPTAILPWVEVMANYSFFRDRAIVNPFDTDLEPALQYNRWTTETAKQLGQWLDLSPAKVESLIYGYTAGVGRGVLEGVDTITGAKRHAPSSDLSRMPGIGAFYRGQAQADAQSLTDFYEARDRLNGLKASITKYRATGDPTKAQALIADNRDLLRRDAAIKAGDAALKALRKRVTAVFEHPGLTPDQKSDQLAAMYRQMRQVARRSLGQPPLR